MQNQNSHSNESKAQVRPSNKQNLQKKKNTQQQQHHVNNFTFFLQIK